MMLRPISITKTKPIPVAELVAVVDHKTPTQTPVVYSIDDDELIASLAKIRAQASPFRKNKLLLSMEPQNSTPTSSEKPEMPSWHGQQDHDSLRKLDSSIHGSRTSTSNSSSRSSEIIEEIEQGSYGCFEDVDIDVDAEVLINDDVIPPDLSLQSMDEADLVPVGGVNDEFIFDLEL